MSLQTNLTFINSPISIDRISPREGVQMIDGHLSEFRAIGVVVAAVAVVVVVAPSVVLMTV